MNIKIRLSFQFTFIVAGILIFFSLLIYFFSYKSQLSKFRQSLLDSAQNAAVLLINVSEVDSFLLKKIQESTISWENEELAITDSAFHLIYGYNIQYLSDKEFLKGIVHDDLDNFSVADKDGICYKHLFDNSKYYVYAMAVDKSRIENLTGLREILSWGILLSILLSVLFSYVFSNRALKPITKIIKSVKEINSLRLGNRLDEGKKKDEIDQLSVTFNEMLSNLEIAFKNQEDFLSNASHELRTPLSVMISESDYILSHEQEKEGYVKHISRLVNDLKEVNALVNSLLELAQINRDTTIQISGVRLDEIIYNAIFQVKTRYQGRKIIPKIQYPESGSELLINGNPGLLTIAFTNLIDNACKFSDDEVTIDFIFMECYVKIVIVDKGIGIPSDELDSIYLPFRRASNVKFKSGFGIGLSLVNRIIELHGAILNVYSTVNKGTRFELLFRKFSAAL